jgi:hypothetical protein
MLFELAFYFIININQQMIQEFLKERLENSLGYVWFITTVTPGTNTDMAIYEPPSAALAVSQATQATQATASTWSILEMTGRWLGLLGNGLHSLDMLVFSSTTGTWLVYMLKLAAAVLCLRMLVWSLRSIADLCKVLSEILSHVQAASSFLLACFWMHDLHTTNIQEQPRLRKRQEVLKIL